MLLQEVFCVYNRARGTELISPDDLLNATALFESLALPLRQCKFASNVVVVQLATVNTAEAARDLLALVKRARKLSASQLAQVCMCWGKQ